MVSGKNRLRTDVGVWRFSGLAELAPRPRRRGLRMRGLAHTLNANLRPLLSVPRPPCAHATARRGEWRLRPGPLNAGVGTRPPSFDLSHQRAWRTWPLTKQPEGTPQRVMGRRQGFSLQYFI